MANEFVLQGNERGVMTSGTNMSYWLDSMEPLRFTPLRENLTTQVAIVGGGIAGLSVAYCLMKAGRGCVVRVPGFGFRISGFWFRVSGFDLPRRAGGTSVG